MVTARSASGVPRKGSLLLRSLLSRARNTGDRSTESPRPTGDSSTESPRPTGDSSTESPRSTGSLLVSGSTSVLRRVRTSPGTAVRASAGAVLLLGVTVAVQGVTETNTPVTAEAADIVVVPSAVPTTDPLGNPDLRQQSLSAATRAQALAQEARVQAAKEAARSAARRAEQARAAKAAAAKAAAAKAAATKAAAARRAAAAKAATARAAAAKAAARAAKARSSAANRPIRSGDARSIARQLLAARGWSGQFGCLNSLWQRESGWNSRAMNPSSGAYGIPQALPGSKMASAGADWRTNPATQIRWGLSYIASRYGTPCGAWAHSQSHGWY